MKVRAMADILVMIETYKRAEIAAAKRARPLAELEQAAKTAAARLSARDRSQARAEAVCADRRDQEGEPLERADPGRLRSAGARARL
jgi:hypothetical protein